MKKFESIYKEGLEAYINDNLILRPFPIFREMEAFALENKIPILSPAAGSILQLLFSLHKPMRVLELGTGLGYSTAWMLSSNISVEIVSLDRNAKELKSAKFFLNQIKKENQSVKLIQTHCIEFLKQSDLTEYDMFFIDCDKICYPEILEILLEKCKAQAWLLFDNVLWHGRLEKEIYSKPSDRAIQDFWDLIKNKNLIYTLFAAADGLLLIEQP
ncbi:MAG: class I SAM-dependent methyltransferase [Leptospiraceae bacterium]|jgi:caffeoyl-CoA O-methyltransferase|nr:class I SAM-dependent methyltransferase [Leptospiraceae bacterium]